MFTVRRPEALTHYPDRCTDPSSPEIFKGDRGDWLVRCRSCGRLALLDPAVVPLHAPGLEQPKPAVRHAWSPWRCRLHHSQPVDRRGRGCAACLAGAQ